MTFNAAGKFREAVAPLRTYVQLQPEDPAGHYHNGDGTFTNVSRPSGIARPLAKAWGVVAADINNDGNMDLFVTNDTVPNFLFANRGAGKFEEIGILAGVGVSAFGKPRSDMGVDAADYDMEKDPKKNNLSLIIGPPRSAWPEGYRRCLGRTCRHSPPGKDAATRRCMAESQRNASSPDHRKPPEKHPER